MIFFLIAAAFKVTALFSLIAISGIYILELLGVGGFKKREKLFKHQVLYLIPIISIFVIIGLWLVYAHNYNQEHQCTYFSTTIFPIWDLNRIEIYDVLHNIKTRWLDQYFHKSVLVFLTICFLFIMIFFRKNNKLIIYSVLIIMAEVIAYFFLQFWTFTDHDYYTIDMYILPVMIIIAAFVLLKTYFKPIFNSPVLKVIFALFLVFNIYYSNQELGKRYEGWRNDFSNNEDIYSITSYLRQIGISSTDTIISIPDYSHCSLYLMNQKGWTEYIDSNFNRGQRKYYNGDSYGIQSSIDNGASYLIVNRLEELYTKPFLQEFCKHLVGSYNDVLIFNLKSEIENFQLEDRIIAKALFCNAELVSNDKKFFISDIDSTLFEFGSSQSSNYAHNGEYSSRLDKNSPYGMTIRFQNLTKGESFLISAWRRTNDSQKGGIVASCSSKQYYVTEFEILETDTTGWEKISMEFFIPSKLKDQELVIYVYNPNPDPVYFDDLEISRYQSVINF